MVVLTQDRQSRLDYKNYILSPMFYKRLCDQWENEAADAIKELERQQRREFSEAERAVFHKRGEHRFKIPDGSRWGDVKAESTNLGEVLTKAMRWPAVLPRRMFAAPIKWASSCCCVSFIFERRETIPLGSLRRRETRKTSRARL